MEGHEHGEETLTYTEELKCFLELPRHRDITDA